MLLVICCWAREGEDPGRVTEPGRKTIWERHLGALAVRASPFFGVSMNLGRRQVLLALVALAKFGGLSLHSAELCAI